MPGYKESTQGDMYVTFEKQNKNKNNKKVLITNTTSSFETLINQTDTLKE